MTDRLRIDCSSAPAHLPLVVAEEEGLLQRAGFELLWRESDDWSEGCARLHADAVEVALAPQLSLLLGEVTGLAGLAQIAADDLSILVVRSGAERLRRGEPLSVARSCRMPRAQDLGERLLGAWVQRQEDETERSAIWHEHIGISAPSVAFSGGCEAVWPCLAHAAAPEVPAAWGAVQIATSLLDLPAAGAIEVVVRPHTYAAAARRIAQLPDILAKANRAIRSDPAEAVRLWCRRRALHSNNPIAEHVAATIPSLLLPPDRQDRRARPLYRALAKAGFPVIGDHGYRETFGLAGQH